MEEDRDINRGLWEGAHGKSCQDLLSKINTNSVNLKVLIKFKNAEREI